MPFKVAGTTAYSNASSNTMNQYYDSLSVGDKTLIGKKRLIIGECVITNILACARLSVRGDDRKNGRAKNGRSPSPAFFSSQTPAVSPFPRSPALSIVSTDREPGTGHLNLGKSQKVIDR